MFHVIVIEFAEHCLHHVEIASAFLLVVGLDFALKGSLDLLLHKSIQLLLVDLFGRVVGLALPRTFGIRLVAKGLSFGLVVSFLETWFVLVAVDCGVVGPPMVLAPFLLLGIRRLGTLLFPFLELLGLRATGMAVLS